MMYVLELLQVIIGGILVIAIFTLRESDNLWLVWVGWGIFILIKIL